MWVFLCATTALPTSFLILLFPLPGEGCAVTYGPSSLIFVPGGSSIFGRSNQEPFMLDSCLNCFSYGTNWASSSFSHAAEL